MSVSVILILFLAGFTHSVWNFLAKRSLNKYVFLWLALVAGVAIFMAPFLWLYSGLSSKIWTLVLVSGVLEAFYFVLLGTSYEKGDLSLVYPIARGSAPIFVTAFSLIVLKEHLSLLGLVGILGIVSGIVYLHVRHRSSGGFSSAFSLLRNSSSRLALLTGLTTACYSVVDKVAMRQVDARLYIYLVFLVAAVAMSPFMFIWSVPAIREEWISNKKTIVGVALLFFGAYYLVLHSLARSKVSYVASVREVSVVFAVLIGVFVLREPFGRQKVVGSCLIFAGILCIALGR
jgi:drug/metabolite transporter (DMT)-like permease